MLTMRVKRRICEEFRKESRGFRSQVAAHEKRICEKYNITPDDLEQMLKEVACELMKPIRYQRWN